MAGKAHGDCLSVFLRFCFAWAGMNAGTNAEGAEVTQKSQKGIPKLFGKGWKQCLCGLQGINGWEGAWGLLVGVFAVLLCLGWNECGDERRRRRSYAEVAKGNTKIVWQRLEAVFMRLAGHKWLGRRMGAACRCFCFVWFVWAEGKLV